MLIVFIYADEYMLPNQPNILNNLTYVRKTLFAKVC